MEIVKVNNLKAKGIILITLFVLFLLFLLPSYTLAANNYNDNCDEYIEEDYPPVDLDIWPDLQYVLEIDSSMLGEGAVHRQYYGKYAVRLETVSDEVEYNVIYKFKEDGVDETVLLNLEEEYMVNSISYNEFFEMNDSLVF